MHYSEPFGEIAVAGDVVDVTPQPLERKSHHPRCSITFVGRSSMGQYFVLVNESRKEMVCPFCSGGTSKLFEWCAQPHSGVLPYLLRKSNETGGGDIPDPQSVEYAGRWAGEAVWLVGDYDESGLYKTAYDSYRNITPALCREYNEFMRCPELRLQEELCSCCQPDGKVGRGG
jgi:hypothetical protein